MKSRFLNSFFSVLGFTLIMVAIYYLKVWQCEIKSRSFEDSEYYSIAGCMVKHKGRWLPIENIRGVDL